MDLDRAGAGARGELVECRVVGGVSCVETMVGGTSMVNVSIPMMGQEVLRTEPLV